MKEMKTMKKLVAILLAAVMVMSLCGVAFAETLAGARTPDTKVTINGLVDGDKVTLYQVLEWGSDDYWVAKAPFNAADCLTQTDVDNLVGQNHETGEKITEGNGLTDALISKIIKKASSANAIETDVAVTSGKYEKTSLSSGMYYALVSPKESTTIYKPIFVSIDYDNENTTNEIAETSITAKKESVTIDKTTTNQSSNQDPTANYTGTANSYNTVGIGDTVDFDIKTMIPAFPASFENPAFSISDALTGLTLKHGEGEIKVYTSDPVAESNLVTAGTTTYTLNATDTGFTVNFAKAFIDSHHNTVIHVVYQGTVDNTATYEVNNKNNTATVKFSNNPDDTSGANELKDETRHYTFSIDALVNGTSERHGTDLIKVGVDQDGKEITEVVQLPNEKWAGALQGAKFTLYQADKTTVYKGLSNLVSGADGTIEINGLDAGIYYLKETDAPEGYVKNPNYVKIEIKPTFIEKTVAAQTKESTYNKVDGTTGTINVTVPEYKYAELQSFEIWIDGAKTSHYELTNDAITTINDGIIGTGSSATDPGTSTTGKIQNPKGIELPSTGGIGTTIFYVAGIVLVLGAAAILVARRKVEAE
jgi:fimbrial isopeptide formation D2 family protein/LPXTG-motif cell wall-anchored protein